MGPQEKRLADPAGEDHLQDAYVFGTATGERLLGFKRAWLTAVLKTHGQTPEYVAGANLSPASRAALKEIDLHFHDLRREAGSRWLDAGLPLHQIQTWLGHTNISQTSTYLAVTDTGGDEQWRSSIGCVQAVLSRNRRRPKLRICCNLVARWKVKCGRGEWIRTTDPSVPNRVLYQAEPRPDNRPILSQLSASR